MALPLRGMPSANDQVPNMKPYLSVVAPHTCEKVIGRSRFIASCAHAEGEEQARAFVAGVRAAHSLATHNCFAFIADDAGNLQRFSDDGEPQGTAGMPILEVIKSKKLVQTAVVVTRYFGGIKLGAGGLVRAYAGACADVLAGAQIREFRPCRALSLTVGYENFDALKKFLAQNRCEEGSTDYADKVTVHVFVSEGEAAAFAAALRDFMAGRVEVAAGESFLHPFLPGE